MAADVERFLEQIVRAFNARDGDALVELMDPEVELELFGGFADLMGARFEGHAGVRRYYGELFAAFETIRMDVEDVVHAHDRVVVLVKLTATVSGTEVPVELAGAATFTLRGGRALRAGLYYDRSDALADAGFGAQ